MKRASFLLLPSVAGVAFATRADAQELTSVKVGIVPSITNAPMFIADKKGFMREEGLVSDYQTFDSAASMMAPLGAGQLDVVAGGPSAGLFNAVARGIDLRVVADKASARPGCGFAPCFPVRDLWAALAHYEQLGFEGLTYTQGMTWAWARLGTAELHLFVKDDHDPATTAAAADLQVSDADGLHRVLQETGASGTSDPYDTPYGR